MKRITKILILTMLFTLCITSTCFASGYSSLSEAETAKFKEVFSTDGVFSEFSDYIITNTGVSNANRTLYPINSNVFEFSEENNTIRLSVTKRKYYISNTDEYGVVTLTVRDYYTSATTVDLNLDNIVMTSTNLLDTDGNQIFPPVEEEEDPEIGGDIMGGETSLSFPDHEYTYWEGVIHENNGATYAVLLVSNDPFSADNFLYREGSGDIQDTLRFSASSSDEINYLVRTYVLQPDGTWLFGSGSSYTGTSMAHNLNVGNILISTKDIENEDGTIFFPVTPVEQLETLAEKIIQTMGIITIVAVSCLVLLISLQVLWKVLKIYLV